MGINYILVFIIILLAVSIIIGSRAGGAKMLFAFIVLAVSIFIAGIIDSGIYRIFDFTEVDNGIYEMTGNILLSEEGVERYETVSQDTNSVINTETAFIEELPVPYDIRLALLENNNSKVYERLGAESFLDYISRYSAYIITAALSFLAAVLISLAGVSLLFSVSGITKHFKSDKEINKAAGAIAGFVMGIFFVYLLLAAAPLFNGIAFGGYLYDQIKSSRILGWLYNNNIVIKAFFLVKTPIWVVVK